MARILSREGTSLRVSGFLFKAMVQSVLLFISETWAVTPRMGRALGGFQDQVAIRLTGRLLWPKPDGKLKYTLVATARDEAGFQTMGEYIQ